MPSPAAHPPQLVWLVLPLAAIALWVAFSFVASCMGWRKFARKYPATSRPPRKAHEVPTAKFGSLVAYRCSVNVVFAEQGIYFYRMFPLTLFHRPFLLPWESVRCVEKKNGLVVGQHFLVDVKGAARHDPPVAAGEGGAGPAEVLPAGARGATATAR